MHVNQQPYRELHDAVLGRSGKFESRALASWIDHNTQEVDWLRSFRWRNGPEAQVSIEDLWRLYALSRVIQLLTLSFQRGTADGSDWPGPAVSTAELSSFAKNLGMTAVTPERFSPFDCEIVSAEQGPDRDQPVTLINAHWPCLMLGDMLIARAGTSITGGVDSFNASIASSSTLYWAYRRKTRHLSHGWGSNSQWRTSFRRDYRVGPRLYYNVDGDHDLAVEELASKRPTRHYLAGSV